MGGAISGEVKLVSFLGARNGWGAVGEPLMINVCYLIYEFILMFFKHFP